MILDTKKYSHIIKFFTIKSNVKSHEKRIS